MIARRAGLAVPSTRVEDEKLGPMADQVKDKVKETGQEALDRGMSRSEHMRSGRMQIRPLGGLPGCLLMIVFSVVASVVLTVLVNLLVR